MSAHGEQETSQLGGSVDAVETRGQGDPAGNRAPEPRTPEHFDPWDSDHTSLVHVLWRASAKGLDVAKADELAQHIMQSQWMRAVRAHAKDGRFG